MKFPFSRLTLKPEQADTLIVLNESYKDKITSLEFECTTLRQELIAAHNEISMLKGQVVAERHAQGKPA